MISIVMPTYNEEKLIGETLDALKRGVEPLSIEIIVSDDGSTDRTAELALSYADRVVRRDGESPDTIGAARNRGAKIARGDIFMFIDADVLLRDTPLLLQAVQERFASEPDLIAMTTSVRVRPDAETWGDRLVLSGIDWYYRAANNLLHWGLAHGKCMIVRASAFHQIGGFDERLVASEDAYLFMQLSKIGRTHLDPKLRVFFSGRRAHAIGWPRLLTQWIINGVWVILFQRAYSGTWARAEVR